MKTNVFLVLTLLIVLFSCSKSGTVERELKKMTLIGNVNDVVNVQLNSNDFNEFSLTNCNNPYEITGIITSKVIKNILKEINFNKSDPDSIIKSFDQALKSELPESFIYTDSTNIDELESKIESILTEVYVNQGFDYFVIKSKKIEDIVNGSNYFNEDQKKRILMFSSVIRQNIGLIKEFFSNSKDAKPTWEECFKAKLKELEDCKTCYIEKIKCAFSWPACLGTKALDCLIATIF